MATFSFTDFIIFSGATNVSEAMYSTIAKGVLGYINNQYNVYPEVTTIVKAVCSTAGQRSFIPKAYPVTGVYRVWYDSDMLDDTTYSYYGEDILLASAVTDVRKPITFELDVGFTDVPDDLVLAIYRHILAVYQALDKHTDTLSKSVNSDGNTSYYTNDVVPAACRETYEFYAGHTLLSF